MIPPTQHNQPMLLDGNFNSSFRFRHRLSVGIELVVPQRLPVFHCRVEPRGIRFPLRQFFRFRHQVGLDAEHTTPPAKKSPLQVFVCF